MLVILVVAGALVGVSTAASGGKVWIYTTIGGIGQATNLSLPKAGDGGPATKAAFEVAGLALDAQGDIYIADEGNKLLRMIDRKGIITTVAGGGTSLQDGIPATSELLGALVGGVAVDKQGNIYISDDFYVRKIDRNGIISTVAGGGNSHQDGVPATSYQLSNPHALVFDPKGNLYIADLVLKKVMKVSPAGTITTFAGGGSTFAANGMQATKASIGSPFALAADTHGNLYIAAPQATQNRPCSRSARRGRSRLLVPNGGQYVYGGAGTAVAVDRQGDVYTNLNTVLAKFSPAGKLLEKIGGGPTGFPTHPTTGRASSVLLGGGPMVVDPQGNVIIAAPGGNWLLKLSRKP